MSDARRAELALQWSEEKFARAFLASPVALLIERLTNDIVIDLNPAFEALSGFRRDEVLGRSVFELGTFVHPEQFIEARALLARDGMTREVKIDWRSRDGALRSCRMSADHVIIAGEPCVFTTIFDLTERKKEAEERLKLEAQLQQAWKMDAVGRLAGGVAHDFNNMLTVILGHTEMALAAADLPAGPRANLLEIKRAAQHSADLTRQLLTFARRQTVAPRTIDLNSTVAGMLSMLKRLVGDEVDLVWQAEPSEPRVRADPSQIDQALASLCVNARDAIGRQGTVTIQTRNVSFDEAYCTEHPNHLPGAFVMLAVSDTGRGIPTETLEHIFEPFFTTKHLGEGIGLGLATVFGIVKQNNGFITVESRPGAGATFRLYFPRLEDGATATVRRPPVGVPMGAGETVLLVEDEPAILELARQMLDRLGYRVLFAASPGEAIELARSRGDEIDLLLTDVVMPEMNGRRLAEVLTGFQPGLHCLFMSGYPASVLARHGVLDEGIKLLRKPFTLHDLAVGLRDLLKNADESS